MCCLSENGVYVRCVVKRIISFDDVYLWAGEFWSDGGYVGTVGEGVNAEVIRDYIKKQGRKGEQLRLADF